MPATCTLMTSPMTRSVVPSGPPACPMWTGVMTITPTITEWATITRGDPEASLRGRPHRAQRHAGRPAGPGPVPAAPEPPGEQQRVGAQQQQKARPPTTAKATADTANAPPRAGSPEGAAEVGTGPGEVRADHRAERGRPHHQGEVPPPPVRRGQVGRGVAGLQSAGRARPEREQPGQQQRQGRDLRRGHGDQRAEDGDGVPGGQPGAASGPVADPGQRHGEHGGTQHAGRAPQAGGAVGAGHVPGEQPTDGDAHGHPQAGQRHGTAEDADRPALDRLRVDVGDRGPGRPGKGWCTSAVCPTRIGRPPVPPSKRRTVVPRVDTEERVRSRPVLTGHPGLVHRCLRPADGRPGGRVGRRSAAATTPSSSRPPDRARRWPPSCGRSTGSPQRPRRPRSSVRCRVLYVSPLKALAVDVERNLRAPLAGIGQAAARLGLRAPGDPGRHPLRRHPGRRAARVHPAADRHPHHHSRVAVPAADQRGPRGAARDRDGDRRRGARRRRHQARRAPRRLPRPARRAARPARPSGSGCRPRCARSRRSPPTWPAGDRCGSSRRPRRSSGTSPSSSRSRT